MSDEKFCRHCGTKYRWLVKGEPDTGVFGEIARELGFPDDLVRQESVDEKPCPHRNGTIIQCCKTCHRQVDMWGCGQAGGMECWCWDSGWRRWRGRVLDVLTFGLWERLRRRYALQRIQRITEGV